MEEERRLRIGYALEAKKIKTFITPSLLNHTQNQGIDLIQIDTDKPLIQQHQSHQFDVIVHKLHSQEWNQHLLQFSSQHPSVVVVDSPVAIQTLSDRVSMLGVVSDLNLSQQGAPFVTTPKQVLIHNSDSLLAMNDVNFPVIAKPLVVDGTADSHNMSLVFNNSGLKKLEPPLVLQDFVNHGGVIFKVYVVGNHVSCVKRSSLPDISKQEMETLGDIMPFSQISNLNSSGYKSITGGDEVEMPPSSFVDQVAHGLRQALKLNLFNFDMIRDAADGSCYYVIDINYFPGYAKMPSYESVFVDFFKAIVNQSNLVTVSGGQESNDNNEKHCG